MCNKLSPLWQIAAHIHDNVTTMANCCKHTRQCHHYGKLLQTNTTMSLSKFLQQKSLIVILTFMRKKTSICYKLLQTESTNITLTRHLFNCLLLAYTEIAEAGPHIADVGTDCIHALLHDIVLHTLGSSRQVLT